MRFRKKYIVIFYIISIINVSCLDLKKGESNFKSEVNKSLVNTKDVTYETKQSDIQNLFIETLDIDLTTLKQKLGKDYYIITSLNSTPMSLDYLSSCFVESLKDYNVNLSHINEKYMEVKYLDDTKITFTEWEISKKKDYNHIKKILEYESLKQDDDCEGFYFKKPIHYYLKDESNFILIISVCCEKNRKLLFQTIDKLSVSN